MPTLARRARSAGAKMPLSPITTRPAGTSFASLSDVASVVSKVLRLRLLMPRRRDFELQRPRQFRFVMDLDENVDPEREGRRLEFGGAAVVDRGQDDEDTIGAGGARFHHLIGVVHEILAQHRQRACGARLAQIVERALERGAVGQDGKTRCAAGLVGLGQGRRIEMRPDQPLRRARLLDFGDQRIVARREPALDGGGKTARRAGGLGLVHDRRERPLPFRRGDFLALVGGDLGENVSHWKPQSGG